MQKKKVTDRTGSRQDGSDDDLPTDRSDRRRMPPSQQRKPRIIERRNGEFCGSWGKNLKQLERDEDVGSSREQRRVLCHLVETTLNGCDIMNNSHN